jgi:small GTP-binding protein
MIMGHVVDVRDSHTYHQVLANPNPNRDCDWTGTIGVDFRFRTLVSSKRVVKLQIWDTAGQERFRTMTSAYYRGAAGFVVCFDLCNLESYESVAGWMAELEDYCGNDGPCPSSVILCGLKSDRVCDRAVPPIEQVTAMASALGITYFETSSKSGEGVETLFLALTKDMAGRRQQQEDAAAAADGSSADSLTAADGGAVTALHRLFDAVDLTGGMDMTQMRKNVLGSCGLA